MRRALNWDAYPVVLTPEETALLLNCRVTTVLELCRKGALPGVKIGGKLWWISRDKLRAMVEGEGM